VGGSISIYVYISGEPLHQKFRHPYLKAETMTVFFGEPSPREWVWRAVGLCSPCLWWWGRQAAVCRWELCPRCPGVGRCLSGVYISSYHQRREGFGVMADRDVRRSMSIFFFYLSHHTTHTIIAERRVEKQCRRRGAVLFEAYFQRQEGFGIVADRA